MNSLYVYCIHDAVLHQCHHLLRYPLVKNCEVSLLSREQITKIQQLPSQGPRKWAGAGGGIPNTNFLFLKIISMISLRDCRDDLKEKVGFGYCLDSPPHSNGRPQGNRKTQFCVLANFFFLLVLLLNNNNNNNNNKEVFRHGSSM